MLSATAAGPVLTEPWLIWERWEAPTAPATPSTAPVRSWGTAISVGTTVITRFDTQELPAAAGQWPTWARWVAPQAGAEPSMSPLRWRDGAQRTAVSNAPFSTPERQA